jgi:hypothetical protein
MQEIMKKEMFLKKQTQLRKDADAEKEFITSQNSRMNSNQNRKRMERKYVTVELVQEIKKMIWKDK